MIYMEKMIAEVQQLTGLRLTPARSLLLRFLNMNSWNGTKCST